jgi:hypothetical protein
LSHRILDHPHQLGVERDAPGAAEGERIADVAVRVDREQDRPDVGLRKKQKQPESACALHQSEHIINASCRLNWRLKDHDACVRVVRIVL